jgi:CelD/BcsL family acetyltransferase involved in cellulose biosynthesis
LSSRRDAVDTAASEASAAGRVVETDPFTDPRWESFVAGHPDAILYQHPRWLEVLQSAYGYELIPLAYEEPGGELGGVLPLLRTRGLFTGRRLSSLPHTPVAGPLASSDAAMSALLSAAVDRVRADGRTRLQLKVREPTLDGIVHGLSGVAWEPSYVLDLPDDSEHLRFGNTRNHGRIKWAVNKAGRLHVTARTAETEADLSAWYGLYLETMREHAVPPRPYRFFVSAWRTLAPHGQIRLLLAERTEGSQTQLLAGSLFLLFGSTVFYAFTGGSREHLWLRPNDLIQWHAIHDAAKEGFDRFDFGEVGRNDAGLADFKSKWGAVARPLYRYYYPAGVGAEESWAGGRLEPLRRPAMTAWKRLPLRVTAVVGGWIYRYF